MSKTAYMLFSGGYDSTLGLVKILLNTDDKYSNYNKLVLIHINNNATADSKNKRESEACNNIMSYINSQEFKSKLGENGKILLSNLKFLTIDVKYNIGFDYSNNIGLSHPLLWIPQIVPFIKSDGDLLIGYIDQDDARYNITDINDLVNICTKIQYGKTINVKFPLIPYNKEDVITHLIHIDHKLFELCSSCESLSWNIEYNGHCQSCVPCNHLKSALLSAIFNESDLRKLSEVSYDDKIYMINYLRDNFNLDVSEIYEKYNSDLDTKSTDKLCKSIYKSELHTGQKVRTRDGYIYTVMKDTSYGDFIISSFNTEIDLNQYDEECSHYSDSKLDIVEVMDTYRPSNYSLCKDIDSVLKDDGAKYGFSVISKSENSDSAYDIIDSDCDICEEECTENYNLSECEE